jgi:hypothetical protein
LHIAARKWTVCIPILLLAAAPSRAETEAQTVARARQNYASIEGNLKSFQRVTSDLSGYSTEGGTLVAYFQGGAVRKLVAQYYGESGRATEEHYFSGGRLFFVLRTELRYDKPQTFDADQKQRAKVATREQNRSYFAQGKLVRWVDETGRNRTAGQEWNTHEREALAQARRLLIKANALLD